MELFDARNLMVYSLRCLAMNMEQMRHRLVDNYVGDNEPMQDHFAEVTVHTIYENSDAKTCLDYLTRFYDALNTATEHELLAEEMISFRDIELTVVADMIVGGIYHDYPQDLLNCSREVYNLSNRLLDACNLLAKSVDNCRKLLLQFVDEAKAIMAKYGYDHSELGDILPLLYLKAWMERRYWGK